jgi:hypothetical protein
MRAGEMRLETIVSRFLFVPGDTPPARRSPDAGLMQQRVSVNS